MPASEVPRVRCGSVVVTADLDVAYLTALCRDPEIYARTADDATPALERLDLNGLERVPGVLGLKVQRAGVAVGMFVLLPTAPQELEVHTAMSQACRGRRAWAAARAGMEYVFTYTRCERVISRCPETNPASLLYATSVGFRLVAWVADWIKEGKTFKSAHVELTRAMWVTNQLKENLCQ